MTKPKRETIKLSPHIANELRARNPDAHNLSYLANCKLAEALGLPPPETHEEARKRGGRTGGRGRKREQRLSESFLLAFKIGLTAIWLFGI